MIKIILIFALTTTTYPPNALTLIVFISKNNSLAINRCLES